MAAVWRAAAVRGGAARAAIAGGLLLALAAMAARNTYAYFGPLQASQEIRYVYPYQLDAAARVIARTPTDSIAYLYSDRWAARFETIKWLAPGHEVIDRGFEFRKDAADDALLDLDADPSRPTVFVLLKPYLDLVDALRDRYPDAIVEEQTRGDEVLFQIVIVEKERDR
jgi:hypothetical protein